MHLVRKGLVNTRLGMAGWLGPNLFGHYKHLVGGKYGKNGTHAANYYLRPMSAWISRSSDRTTLGKVVKEPSPNWNNFKRGRTIMRMKRKGKMANIYKSNIFLAGADYDFMSPP